MRLPLCACLSVRLYFAFFFLISCFSFLGPTNLTTVISLTFSGLALLQGIVSRGNSYFLMVSRNPATATNVETSERIEMQPTTSESEDSSGIPFEISMDELGPQSRDEMTVSQRQSHGPAPADQNGEVPIGKSNASQRDSVTIHTPIPDDSSKGFTEALGGVASARSD